MSGLIIQWGYVPNGDTGRTVTTHVSFSSIDSYVVSVSILANTSASGEEIVIKTKNSANSFSIDTTHNRPFTWFAIGY